jgi:hypothetical protein
VRRVDWEPQVDFSSARSWEVKKAREVLRSEGVSVDCRHWSVYVGRTAMRHGGVVDWMLENLESEL